MLSSSGATQVPPTQHLNLTSVAYFIIPGLLQISFTSQILPPNSLQVFPVGSKSVSLLPFDKTTKLTGMEIVLSSSYWV